MHVPGGTETDLSSDTICFGYNLHTNKKTQIQLDVTEQTGDM